MSLMKASRTQNLRQVEYSRVEERKPKSILLFREFPLTTARGAESKPPHFYAPPKFLLALRCCLSICLILLCPGCPIYNLLTLHHMSVSVLSAHYPKTLTDIRGTC